MAAIAPALGSAFEPAQAVTTAAGPDWEPDCGFLPSGELVVAWSDLTSGVAHLTWASRAATAAAFGPPSPVDASTAAEPRVRGTQIQTALSNDARVMVWLDYRNGAWDVYAARWGGAAYGSIQRIDGAPPEDFERLCGEPRVEALGDRVVATWSDLRNRGAHPDIGLAASSDGGVTWLARVLVPDGPGSMESRTRGGTAMPRYRPALAFDPAGAATLVFQDLAPEKSAISSALFSGTSVSEPLRIDDTADSPVSLTRPRVASLGASRIVVWEDDRDGSYRIYATRLD
jgi:hypothetical protein